METAKKQAKKSFVILLLIFLIGSICGTATNGAQQPIPILELGIPDTARVVDYDDGIYVVGTSGGNLYIINEAGEYTVTALGAGSIVDVRIEHPFIAVAAGTTVMEFSLDELTPVEQWRRTVSSYSLRSVDISGDGAYVAYLSAGYEGSVGVFDYNGTLVSSYSISWAGVVCWLDATDDMEYIAITAEVPPYSGENSGVELYRFDGNSISRRWGKVLVNKYETTEVRVSEDKDYIAVATSSGIYMNLLDLPTGDLLWQYETPNKEQYACDGDDNLEYVIGANQAWSPPYPWFVLKNLGTSYEVIASGDMNGPINDLDSNPDSSLLAFGSDTGEFILLGKMPDDTNDIILEGNVGKLIDAIEIGNNSILVGGQTFINLYGWSLEFEKVDDVNEGECVGPGDEINYRIDYNYHGDVNCPDINDVNIIDYLPDEVEFVSSVPEPNEIIDSNIIWHIGTLSPGESGFVTLKVKVKPCIEPGGTITNCCKIRSGEEVRSIACEDTPVCSPTLTKVDNVPSCVWHNANITYSICYAANGYGDTNVVITDSLPNEVNFVWASNGGDYDEGNRTVTWDDIDFPADAYGCVELIVQFNSTAEPDFTITNCCVMTGDSMASAVTACEDTPKCNASNPSPADGATDVPVYVVLRWLDGALSEARDIYLGTNWDDVTDANRSNPLGVLVSEGQGPNSCDPYGAAGFLKLDQRYYWRVDEVNIPLPPIWQGEVWSFTTSPNSVVDNFNSYGTSAAMKNVWKDYWVNGTCAEVFLATDPNRGGPPYQSMRYEFKNYTYEPYYSEAEATIGTGTYDLKIDPNWLGMNAKSLSLWFYGKATNDANEQMYIKLTDSGTPVRTAKVFYDGSPNDLRQATWHEWNIALQEFIDNNNVNLAKVVKITIGFGDGTPATSDGTVFFEDIRLYATRCVLSKRSGDFAKVDYAPPGNPAGDCVINFREFGMMADDWLITPPPDPNIDLHGDGTIDFRDLAVLAEMWLEEELWPY